MVNYFAIRVVSSTGFVVGLVFSELFLESWRVTWAKARVVGFEI